MIHSFTDKSTSFAPKFYGEIYQAYNVGFIDTPIQKPF